MTAAAAYSTASFAILSARSARTWKSDAVSLGKGLSLAFESDAFGFLLEGLGQLLLCFGRVGQVLEGDKLWRSFHAQWKRRSLRKSIPVRMDQELFPCKDGHVRWSDQWAMNASKQHHLFRNGRPKA